MFSYGVYLRDADRIFKEIAEQDINYSVLRWFDELPELDPKEDIDLLVSDFDFYRLKRILQRGRPGVLGFVKFDVYPESNLEGDMSYYPPHLASQILKNKRQLECGIWVPSIREHFLSLTYHALFHKGFGSGLPTEFVDRRVLEPKRDFASYLSTLASQASIPVINMSMTGLERVLDAHGWLPPLDVYLRRSKRNDWVRLRAHQIFDSTYRFNHGLAVFILRDVVSGTYLESLLKRRLLEDGASIIDELEVSGVQALKLVQATRGGDWGRPRLGKGYGGMPAKIIIAQHHQDGVNLEPERLPSGAVEYDWLLKIKKEIRAEANSGVSDKMQCHVLHTSDNGVEAAHYRELISQIKASDKDTQS
jgi:hypothetical protein